MKKSHLSQLFRLRRNKKSFTLVEILFAAAILAVSLCGLLSTYLNMFVLTDLIRDQVLVTHAVLAKAEEIKNVNFTSLSGAAGSFDLTGYGFSLNQSKGMVEVQENYLNYTSALTKVRIIACYQSRNRTIGEDINFNGLLDVGEDANGNGRLDSPIETVLLISK